VGLDCKKIETLMFELKTAVIFGGVNCNFPYLYI
jgi:hypothetical protein